MIPLTLNGEQYLLVFFPEDGLRPNIKKGILYWTTPLYQKDKQVENDQSLCLPVTGVHYDWEIVGKGDQLTEDQWKGIVHSDYFDGIGYQFANYECAHKFEFGKRKNTATESGHSLIKSNGMEPGDCLLIKKI